MTDMSEFIPLLRDNLAAAVAIAVSDQGDVAEQMIGSLVGSLGALISIKWTDPVERAIELERALNCIRKSVLTCSEEKSVKRRFDA